MDEQEYLNALSYNHTGTQLFDIKPHSSMITLMETARIMVIAENNQLECKCSTNKKQMLINQTIICEEVMYINKYSC